VGLRSSRLTDARFAGLELESVRLARGQRRHRVESRYAFVFPKAGRGFLRAGTERYSSTRNVGYVFGPGCAWGAEAASHNEWHYRTIFIDQETLHDLARRRGVPLDRLDPDAVWSFGAKTCDAAQRLFGQFAGDAALLHRAAALMDFLAALRWELHRVGRRVAKAHVLVSSANYMQAHWTETVRVADLARAAALSRFHFHRVFRATVGQPPHGYVTALRIEYAERLLRDGRPVAEAAHLAGFCDQSHLHRVFRRCVGMTPGRYRLGCVVPDRPAITAATVFGYRCRNGEALLDLWRRLRAARATALTARSSKTPRTEGA
jgi:AraC-like DNA-binding protein